MPLVFDLLEVFVVEDMLLGLFLFVVYFSFACCFFYDPGSIDSEIQEPIEQQVKMMLEEIDEVVSDEVNLEDLDLDNLTYRQARRVAKMLDIRQKVKGKDQPKKWLVAQIKKRLSDEPQKVSVVAGIVHAA